MGNKSLITNPKPNPTASTTIPKGQTITLLLYRELLLLLDFILVCMYVMNVMRSNLIRKSCSYLLAI